MLKPIITFVAAILMAPVSLWAFDAYDDIANCPEKSGGHYFAYPVENISPDYGSKAPKGYKPFYVSHYGRHGSRYRINEADYTRLTKRLDDAAKHNALSPAGLRLKAQLDTVWEEARGRAGELSPLGARQHHGIARRMVAAYPEIIADGAEVTATSTPVMRCAHSMFAFVTGLKEVNPSLQIPLESGERNMWFMNYHSDESNKYSSKEGPWYQAQSRFAAAKTNPDRLVASIFSDKEYADRWVDPVKFMEDLYGVAVDIQDVETDTDLFSYFTTQELYDLWSVTNSAFYARNSSYPLANGTHLDNSRGLVRHILDNADEYVNTGKHGATLRFGHDGNITPLTALLKIEGCYTDAINPEDVAKEWATYRITPMAANLQMVFFRPEKGNGDVLVRVYLNENDAVLPLPTVDKYYYRWSDLRPYLDAIANPK